MASNGKEGEERRSSNVFVRAWTAYESGLGAFVAWVARGSGNLGALTARRPWTVMLTSVILSILICVGWLRFRLENDADVLWVPQTGKSRDDGDYVDVYYPKSAAGASFYAQLQPSRYSQYGGNNALQMPVTWEMFQLHNKIMNLTVSFNGQQAGFNTLCYKRKSGGCDVASGYLYYWQNDFSYYIGNISGSYTDPTAGNATVFRTQVSNTSYPDGQPVSLLSVFGGTTFAYNPFQLTSAQVIAQNYALDDTLPADVVKAWNDAFTDLMQAQLPKQQYMTFTWITGSSVGEELGKAINNDMVLVIISLIIFILVAILVLSKFDLVKTRTVLAVAGVFVTALGIMSGWGWGMIFGMPFTPLQQLSPFILLGMGVDVIFILVKSYDIIIQRQPWLTLEESFRKLMSTAGLSVQVTLLCSAVAFALGAVDELASVKWFSAFACLNTLMIMVLAMTAFIGFMVLTEKRIAAGRMDFCCCCRRRPSPPSPSGSGGSGDGNALPVAMVVARPAEPVKGVPVAPLSVASPHTANGNANGSGKVNGDDARVHVDQVELDDDQVKDENVVKKFFRKYYAPLLTRWWFKVLVVACFLAYAAVSAYGITQLKYGQPLSDLAPDGSYLQDYDAVQQATYAQQVGPPVGMYFRDIDVSQPSVQYKMLKSWDVALQNEFINSSTSAFLNNWLVDFINWAQKRNATVVASPNNCYNPLIGKVTGNLAGVITPVTISGCVPQAQFYPLLDQWLGGKRNSSSVIRKQDAQGTILTSKFNMMLRAAGNDDKFNAEMITSIHGTDSDINSQLWAQENSQASENVVFIYGGNFLFAEGDSILPEAALLYFMLALVGVFFVTTFMLVNPLASIMMMVAVGMVILYLFGELYIGKIRFNQVSVINMIMATGLSVDYAVYFAQKFMTSDGVDGNARMTTALVDTGFAVFLGGVTALLGTIPMAFSKSVIIRTFFFLIFFTIIFALLVGLMLMPVIFSVLAPLVPPVKSALMVSSSGDRAASGRYGSGPLSPSDTQQNGGSVIEGAGGKQQQKQVQLPGV